MNMPDVNVPKHRDFGDISSDEDEAIEIMKKAELKVQMFFDFLQHKKPFEDLKKCSKCKRQGSGPGLTTFLSPLGFMFSSSESDNNNEGNDNIHFSREKNAELLTSTPRKPNKNDEKSIQTNPSSKDESNIKVPSNNKITPTGRLCDCDRKKAVFVKSKHLNQVIDGEATSTKSVVDQNLRYISKTSICQNSIDVETQSERREGQKVSTKNNVALAKDIPISLINEKFKKKTELNQGPKSYVSIANTKYINEKREFEFKKLKQLKSSYKIAKGKPKYNFSWIFRGCENASSKIKKLETLLTKLNMKGKPKRNKGKQLQWQMTRIEKESEDIDSNNISANACRKAKNENMKINQTSFHDNQREGRKNEGKEEEVEHDERIFCRSVPIIPTVKEKNQSNDSIRNKKNVLNNQCAKRVNDIEDTCKNAKISKEAIQNRSTSQISPAKGPCKPDNLVIQKKKVNLQNVLNEVCKKKVRIRGCEYESSEEEMSLKRRKRRKRRWMIISTDTSGE